jgi:hypothetical protein
VWVHQYSRPDVEKQMTFFARRMVQGMAFVSIAVLQ